MVVERRGDGGADKQTDRLSDDTVVLMLADQDRDSWEIGRRAIFSKKIDSRKRLCLVIVVRRVPLQLLYYTESRAGGNRPSSEVLFNPP